MAAQHDWLTSDGARYVAKRIPIEILSRGENLIAKIPNKVDCTIYSLYTEDESDHKGSNTAILGCKVSTLAETPEGMTGRSFDGDTYMKTSAKGDLGYGFGQSLHGRL